MNFINKMLNNHRTHWQWYKSFFSITILRYLVTWFSIVPVFVKLFQGINEPIIIQTSVTTLIKLNLSLPFSWEVLWLSSLAFVFALLLYQVACPAFIKTYNSYGDYKSYKHSPRWIIWETLKVLNDKNEIDKLFERLDEKKYINTSTKTISKNEVLVEEKQSVAYFKYGDKTYSLALPNIANGKIDVSKTDIMESEIFWEIFGRFSSSKKIIRLIIIVLLSISALLFSYVLIQNIYSGISYFIY